ncbi:MAG: hypothetical protein A2V70_05405 [Planctomycetes bacterium RBG_13_63_9]|nr:MAG: hypothetical protein A2V70_05405 [Planctomycetes bacterium RBG_13_63_9]
MPWFDVAHHDRFILHGAGYPSRYEGGLDPRLHGIYSDDYMATEVLTGHPAMVSRPFGRDVVRKYWLLGELMRALALRRIESVEFADGDLHRQRVLWSGGGEVWVNRGQSDWNVAGNTLPQYGFVARVPTDKGPVEASITRREGIVVEAARSAEHIYVNGRQLEVSSAGQNPEGKPTDFGPVVTEGGCRLTAAGDGLTLTVLPDGRAPQLTVRLRPEALPWKLPDLTHVEAIVEAIDETGKPSDRRPLGREGELLRIECQPGVFGYRLRPR